MKREALKKDTPPRKRPHNSYSCHFNLNFSSIDSFLVWMWRPSLDIITVIYNKTVPDSSTRQHAGIMWFLKQAKVPTVRGEVFDYKKDYYGFFPDAIEEERIKPLPFLHQHVDMLYIADTYGVYKGLLGWRNPH